MLVVKTFFSGSKFVVFYNSCVLNVVEAIVDSDKDGIPDQKDNCPQNYNPKQEDMDGDGIGDVCDSCDDRDFDNDKIKNCLDKCPDKPETYNQYQDDDGCPDEVPKEIEDSDGDGIPDDKDKCPKEKETFNNYQDDDGCPDEVPPQKPEMTPKFSSCVEILMLRANLSYIQAKEICSQDKEKRIRDFVAKTGELNLPEIGIINEIKISKKTTVIDGIQIDPLPIIVDVEGRNVRLEPTSRGLVIEDDGVQARGDIEVGYKDGKITSGRSGKEIRILPSQVGQKIGDKIKEIKIEDTGTPQYLVRVVKHGKLFRFIPISFPWNYQIDAENGALSEIRPWWSFAVKTLPTCRPPLILIGGTCCGDENHNKICDKDEQVVPLPATNVEVSLPESECGDSYCYIGESRTCCQDCGCPSGYRCLENGQCSCATLAPINEHFYSENYIVVTLDEIIVHDDQDPVAAGELQLITMAATGDKAQSMYWPVELWRPVNSGNRVLGGTPIERIPVFSLKESQMGEALAISFQVVDNDELPQWLEDLLGYLLEDLLGSLGPSSILRRVIETLDAILPLPHLEAEVRLEDELRDAFNELIAENDLIGAVTQIHRRAEHWGVRDEPYVIRRGGMTVKYSIHRVVINRGASLGVKINKIVVRDTGDYFDGEVRFKLRCTTSFGEGKIQEVKYRIPLRGTFDWGDGNTLYGLPGPSVEVSPGVFEPTWQPIIECEGNGPFIFTEVSVWDEDEPEVGDEHDLLGHFTETILYPEAEAGIYTIPRGNIDIWLEYTKR